MPKDGLDPDGEAPPARRASARAGLRVAWLGLGLLAAGLGAVWLYATTLPPLDLAAAAARSTVVLDRSGTLLRPFATPDGRWRLPVTAEAVDPRFQAMLLAYEDRRFARHPGIDPAALLRAAGQWLTRGRIVSGGSTLSMQVARLVEPRRERSLGAKLRQMVRAVTLERRLGKPGMLDLYLALAPYGGPLEGVGRRASRISGGSPHGSRRRRPRSSSPCRRPPRRAGRTDSRTAPAPPATGCSIAPAPGAS